jgi:hypothetical protein
VKADITGREKMKSGVWRRRVKRTIVAALGVGTGSFVLLPLLQQGRHPYSDYLIHGGLCILTIMVLILLIPFIYDICRKKSKYPKAEEKE